MSHFIVWVIDPIDHRIDRKRAARFLALIDDRLPVEATVLRDLLDIDLPGGA